MHQLFSEFPESLLNETTGSYRFINLNPSAANISEIPMIKKKHF
jgi:hypothetical protein